MSSTGALSSAQQVLRFLLRRFRKFFRASPATAALPSLSGWTLPKLRKLSSGPSGPPFLPPPRSAAGGLSRLTFGALLRKPAAAARGAVLTLG